MPPRPIELPGLAIERAAREVRIDGTICTEEGILEYLAVADGGKTYESVFALHCRPSHLQVAMLIAGYQEGEVPPSLRGDLSPKARAAGDAPPTGAPQVTRPAAEYWKQRGLTPTRVTVDVQIGRRDGWASPEPVENFLIDRATGRVPPRLVWAFTGSFFSRDQDTGIEFFAADVERSIIALWYDPTALLNLAREAGNPYRAADAGYRIRREHLPPRGTPIRLILRPTRRDTR